MYVRLVHGSVVQRSKMHTTLKHATPQARTVTGTHVKNATHMHEWAPLLCMHVTTQKTSDSHTLCVTLRVSQMRCNKVSNCIHASIECFYFFHTHVRAFKFTHTHPHKNTQTHTHTLTSTYVHAHHTIMRCNKVSKCIHASIECFYLIFSHACTCVQIYPHTPTQTHTNTHPHAH